MKKQIFFAAAIQLFSLIQVNLSAQNTGMLVNLQTGNGHNTHIYINQAPDTMKAFTHRDEQQLALETAVSELGRPNTLAPETDRTKAVDTFVTDTDQFSTQEVAAMRASLSDEYMSMLRKQFVERQTAFSKRAK